MAGFRQIGPDEGFLQALEVFMGVVHAPPLRLHRRDRRERQRQQALGGFRARMRSAQRAVQRGHELAVAPERFGQHAVDLVVVDGVDVSSDQRFRANGDGLRDDVRIGQRRDSVHRSSRETRRGEAVQRIGGHHLLVVVEFDPCEGRIGEIPDVPPRPHDRGRNGRRTRHSRQLVPHFGENHGGQPSLLHPASDELARRGPAYRVGIEGRA